MKRRAGLCVGAVALLALVVLVQAAQEESSNAAAGRLGAPAAPLTGLQWIKGGPVQIEKGSVYVVEFWATWCPPCRTSIPHLTEIQRQFKDRGVTIVGISDETADVVKPFVAQMDEQKKMEYAVAIDPEGQVSKGYMEAFGIEGIPHAFIVGKDGVVLWNGHPMDAMDEVLQQIVAGQFDHVAYARQKAAREAEEARLLQRYKDYFAKVIANSDEAPSIGRQLVAESSDAGMLNSLSWTILTRVPDERRDLELARDAAAKAVKLTQENEPAILDTYALALYELGRKYVAQAVTIQKKAVELTDNPQAKESLSKALQRYEAATVE
ncbi:MAG TPA: redoxin domain-containing protein [Sedimentisphaerales bacterium]|nr:redoxin domain-containing protein [Sedimentisphaerales bacterium]HRS11441.1 redoxin domain-containing protein [Sedimentisphaerales bacterium]HRV48021.1 redoxin domain-containing protein [Sedimentisphaerales bacterium]